MTVKERLWQFVETQEIKKGEFCKKFGLSQSNFAKSNLKSSLSSDLIVKILIEYPQLNPDWLFVERGEMIRDLRDISGAKNCDACPKIMSLQEKIINLQSQLLEGGRTAPIVPARKVRRTDAVSTAMAVLGGGVAASTDNQTSSLPSSAGSLVDA